MAMARRGTVDAPSPSLISSVGFTSKLGGLHRAPYRDRASTSQVIVVLQIVRDTVDEAMVISDKKSKQH
jgi:hypothetical protein